MEVFYLVSCGNGSQDDRSRIPWSVELVRTLHMLLPPASINLVGPSTLS